MKTSKKDKEKILRRAFDSFTLYSECYSVMDLALELDLSKEFTDQLKSDFKAEFNC
jgi:hypothetical protein